MFSNEISAKHRIMYTNVAEEIMFELWSTCDPSWIHFRLILYSFQLNRIELMAMQPTLVAMSMVFSIYFLVMREYCYTIN